MLTTPKHIPHKDIIWGLAILSFGISAYFLPLAPEMVAIHWNTQGVADIFIPRAWGVFLMPFISIMLISLILFLVEHKNYKDTIRQYSQFAEVFIILFALFLYYLNLIVLAWNVVDIPPLSIILAPAIAAFLWHAGTILRQTTRAGKTPTAEKTVARNTAALLKLAAVISLCSMLTPEWSLLIIGFSVCSICAYGAGHSLHLAPHHHRATLKVTNHKKGR